ncbi:MAG: ABC transporter ATP-binding protein [Erysipelotrichales bacterium]|nr:ABC transporter ATP-binding protein [Erysipelotrichales bacterium]
MALLELKDVKYSYKNEYQTVDAVKGISYTFDAGKMYAIVGKSGSGKTTLLSLMAGLDLPTSGEILYEGKPTSKINLNKYRREKVAVVYQNFMLFPLLTLTENVMFPMEQVHVPLSKAKARAKEMMKKVGLEESQFKRFPAMISGGEKQRVAIARAIGTGAKVILADEPTGNLDSANGNNIMEILTKLAREDNYCVIMVTHDESFAGRADEILRISDGLLVEDQ